MRAQLYGTLAPWFVAYETKKQYKKNFDFIILSYENLKKIVCYGT